VDDAVLQQVAAQVELKTRVVRSHAAFGLTDPTQDYERRERAFARKLSECISAPLANLLSARLSGSSGAVDFDVFVAVIRALGETAPLLVRQKLRTWDLYFAEYGPSNVLMKTAKLQEHRQVMSDSPCTVFCCVRH